MINSVIKIEEDKIAQKIIFLGNEDEEDYTFYELAMTS